MIAGLRAALEQRGVKLTEDDERWLEWLASRDRSTCEWFVSIITRAASAGLGNVLTAQMTDGDYHRVELVTDAPERVQRELVKAGAELDQAVNSFEVGTADKSRIRWRQGSVKVAGTPVKITTAMAPVTCRDPHVDLGDVGDEPAALVGGGRS